MRSRSRNSARDQRDVRAEGFRDGSQQVAPVALPKELQAKFSQAREGVQIAAADGIKRAEAVVAGLDQRIVVAGERWQIMKAELGELPPALLLPLCAILSAVLVIIGESLFLSPVMDGFGISEYWEQRCLAAVIVLVASGAFEISKKLFHRISRPAPEAADDAATPKRVWVERSIFAVFALLTLATLAFIFVLGWWRAEEMAFAATATGGAMQNDSWSRFMGDNLPLTRTLVVLFALMLPAFVAFAFEYGADKLRHAMAWRRSRKPVERLPQQREHAQKKLEAATEKRDRQVTALTEQQAEWTESYLQSHELGRRVGAWRLPLWQALIKIAGFTLLMAALMVVANLIFAAAVDPDRFATERYVIAALVVLGAASVYAYHALYAWDRPTARQLEAQAATLFANVPRTAVSGSIAALELPAEVIGAAEPIAVTAGDGYALAGQPAANGNGNGNGNGAHYK
jgi:ABC-type multidrug transport system fused ATPase/permease subunit